VIDTLSQIFMKYASLSLSTDSFSVTWFVELLNSPFAYLAILTDITMFFCWIFILKKAKLSVAFPISSISFITILIAGSVVFHETIANEQYLGTIILLTGIYLISSSSPKEKN